MIQFKHASVLIPVDFSATSMLAIKHGAFFAQYTKADLHLLHVINTNFGAQNMFLPLVQIEDFGPIEDKAMGKLREVADYIQKEFGVDANCIVRVGSASSAINEVARETNASLLVMGTHGYSPLQELVIGSTALKVITKAPCPVMVMNSEASHRGYQRILLPLDNTTNTKQKVNYAIDLAKKFSASLNLVGLVRKGDEDELPQMKLVIKQVEELAADKGVVTHSHVLSGVSNSAMATVKYGAEINSDLVVIMTDQDAELSGFFLGPYSQQIIHHSKVPVLAIRPADLYAGHDLSLIPGTTS